MNKELFQSGDQRVEVIDWFDFGSLTRAGDFPHGEFPRLNWKKMSLPASVTHSGLWNVTISMQGHTSSAKSTRYL